MSEKTNGSHGGLPSGVEALFAQYVERLNAGEAIDIETIRADHPEVAQELIDQLRLLRDVYRDSAASRDLGTLGDYTLRRQIGRGGMGVVYEAWQNSVERQVALKVLPGAVAVDDKRFHRFMREARAAAKLNHPNIVGVHGMGQEENTPYYSMDFVEGETLAQILARTKDAESETETPFGSKNEVAYFHNMAKAFAHVADGLQHAHSKGITHRDIKPSNLILDQDGRLRILDFGLALLEGQESLTLSGDFVGTPLYMSPEQARRKKVPVDHRTDVYSLGATMYEAICGRPPFRGKDHADTLSQIIDRNPTEPRKTNPRVPKDFETIVLKCARKNAADRYGTAEALAQDLQRFVRGDPIEARPQPKWEKALRFVRRNALNSAVISALLVLVPAAAWFAISAHQERARVALVEYEPRVRSALTRLMPGYLTLRAEGRIGNPVTSRFWFTPGDLQLVAIASESDGIAKAVQDLAAAAERVPARPEAGYHRAQALALLRKDDEAIQALDRVLRSEPSFVPARILRARLSGETVNEKRIEDWSRASQGVSWASSWLDAYRAARRAEERVANRDLEQTKKRWLEVARAFDHLARMEGPGNELFLGSSIETRLAKGAALLAAGALDEAEVAFVELRALWPTLLEPWLLLGKTYFRGGRPSRAEATFAGLHDMVEHKDIAAAWIAITYESLRQYEHALRWSRRISREQLSRRLRAVFLCRLWRSAEAIEAARSAIALNEADPVAHAVLGWSVYFERLFSSDGRDESLQAEGLRSLRRACELDSANPFPFAILALTLLRENDRAGAQHAVDRALALDPSHPIAHVAGGILAYSRGRLDEAEKLVRRGVSMAPDDSYLQTSLAMVCYERRDPTAAIEAAMRATELDPNWALPRVLLGLCRLDEGKYDEAGEHFFSASTLPPENGKGLTGLARVRFLQGKVEEALAVIDRAISLDERRVERWLARARILRHLNRDEESAASIRKAEELGSVFSVRSQLGWTLVKERRYREAEETFGELAELVPARSGAYTGLCNARLKLGKHAEAIEAAERAVELAPRNASARREFGHALFHAGEFLKALDPLMNHLSRVRGAHWTQRLLARSLRRIEDSGRFPPAEVVAKLTRIAESSREIRDDLQAAVASILFHAPYGDRDQAYALAVRAVENSEWQGDAALCTLAEITSARGDARGAVRLLEKAVLLPDVTRKSLRALAELREQLLPEVASAASVDAALENVQPGSRAEKELAAAMRTAANAPAVLSYLDARLLQRGDRPELALETLEGLAGVPDADVLVHLRRIESLRIQGDFVRADAYLQEVLNRHDDRRLWTLWLETAISDLHRGPRDLLESFPSSSTDGYAADMRSLLEELERGTVRINCGGERYTDSGDRIWERDRFFEGGSRSTLKYTLQGPVRNTGDHLLYRTFRDFDDEDSRPAYRIPLPAGTYRITFHFAELDLREPGARRFDVRVERRPALTNFEPASEGFAVANAHPWTAVVDDGTLDVEFVPVIGAPKISAIEIVATTSNSPRD